MSTSNDQIYAALLDIKQDIGGLKATSDLFLKGLTNHSERLVVVEDSIAKQKGALKVWGMVATAAAALVSAAIGTWKH